MVYTIVPEVEEGDSWTAKDMNTYVKDNFAACVPDIFTTKGDIAVATGDNVMTRLSVGSDDEHLFADSNESSGIKWQSLPESLVLAYKNSSQSIDYESWTHITTLVESVDMGSEFNSHTFTANSDGYYYVSCSLTITTDTPQYINTPPYIAALSLSKNGEIYSHIARYQIFEDEVCSAFHMNGNDILYLDEGDYVAFYIYRKTYNINFTISGGSNASYIAIKKLGRKELI